MSKFLVSSFSKKLLIAHNFSTTVSGKRGKGKGPIVPISLKFSKSKKSKSKEISKRKAKDVLSSQLPNENSLPKISKRSRKKPRTFANTDENGLPLLNSKDCFRRVEFASKMLSKLEKNPELLDAIVFSDEGNFMLSQLKQKSDIKHTKSSQSDLLQRYGESRRLPQIVWLGMTTKYIIGPYFFNSYLTDRTYLKMLQSFLIPQLKDISGGNIETFCFQQDGNPPHRSRQVLSYLTKTFGTQLISYGCPLMWPPKSQDLTPLDYFLWSYLKDKLHANCTTQELCTVDGFRASLIDQIEGADEELIKKVVRQFPRRLEKCIEANGERFEFVDKE